MAGWVADKSWLLIMVLQIDLENSATGLFCKPSAIKIFTSINVNQFESI